MGKLFGTDGIRGVANRYPMDIETTLSVGSAVAGLFNGGKNPSRPHIVIGQDTRLSGDMIAQAVAAGVCSAGVDVSLLGVLPTPGIAYVTVATGAAAGIVISASHNPYQDNGIKVFDGQGFKLSDEAEAQIERNVLDPKAAENASSENIGRVRNTSEPGNLYIDFLKSAVNHPDLNDLSIVLDCANGATYKVAPALFQQLGAHVIPLFCAPNGLNINAGCGSQHPEVLAQTVLDQNADIGLAFDGDGDRLIAVDEKGKVLSGDQILAICAKDMKATGTLKNDVVVSTVMSNMGLKLALKQMDIRMETAQVGDRHVMELMRAQGAVLGGEDSGHMIFLDAHTTGDGMLAGLRLLQTMQSADRPLSELARVITVYPQELINVDVTSKPELESVPDIVRAIQQAEADLGDQGRVLVRYSGTQNKCRVMVEGPTKKITHLHCRQIADAVARAIG